MWRIRRIIRRTKNLLRWLPIIWQDEQWDYYYILEVLKHKLILTADHTRKHGYHVNSNYDADRMMLCVKLIEKVQNEDYLMEMVNEKLSLPIFVGSFVTLTGGIPCKQINEGTT